MNLLQITMNIRYMFMFLSLIAFIYFLVVLLGVRFDFKANAYKFLSENNIINPNLIDDPLNDYFKIHTKIFNEKNSTLRKIFFTHPHDGGYGNRIYAIISSALISIILDCQLVNVWQTKEFLNIDPPINLFDKVNINAGYNSSVNQTYWFPHPKYPFARFKNITYLIEKPYYIPENYTRYVFGSGRPLFTEISANIRYYDKFKYYKLARKETLDEAYKALNNYEQFKNEELQRRVLNVAFEIGGNILNRIWTPNQDMKNLVSHYVERHFTNNFVIGFQMRAADSGYLDEAKDYLKFISCAHEIEKEFLLKSKKLETTFKWFIATDSDKIRSAIFGSYGEKSFTTNGTVGHSGGGSTEQFKKTVLDIELLSRCDEIIVTGASTFGWTAAMKSLKLPFYLTGVTMERCQRADLGSQPSNRQGARMFT